MVCLMLRTFLHLEVFPSECLNSYVWQELAIIMMLSNVV